MKTNTLPPGVLNEIYHGTSDVRGLLPNRVSKHMKSARQLLLEAISADEFHMVYQPQTDITGETVIGVEALARWNNPRYGLISPEYFIPLAEELNLIGEIGEIVIQKACKQLARWKSIYNCQLRMAINVSCMQLQNDRIIEIFEYYIGKYSLKPGEIEIELTESTMINDKVKVIGILNDLRAMGIRTAIDDFGTGYSSLNCLVNMPFDLLKIDKSFIQNLDIDNAHTTITRSIIHMAKDLGMEVLAEGVETELQKQLLHDSSCDMLQGNLISHPVLADQVPAISGMIVS